MEFKINEQHIATLIYGAAYDVIFPTSLISSVQGKASLKCGLLFYTFIPEFVNSFFPYIMATM